MITLTPVDIVQQQLDAYNRRDIEAFMSFYADDAAIFDLGATVPSFTGKEQIRQRYTGLFASSPALHCELGSRTTFGRVVIDMEHITGREGSLDVYEVLAIYEVLEQKIQRMHFVRR